VVNSGIGNHNSTKAITVVQHATKKFDAVNAKISLNPKNYVMSNSVDKETQGKQGGRRRVDGRKDSGDFRNLGILKVKKGKEEFRIKKMNYSFGIDGPKAVDTEDSLDRTHGERIGRRAGQEEFIRQIRDEIKAKNFSSEEIREKISINLLDRIEGSVVKQKPNLKGEVVVKSANANIKYLGQKNVSKDGDLGLAGKKIGCEDVIMSGCSKMVNKLPIHISISTGKDSNSRFNRFNNDYSNQNNLKLEIF
jgi:hypothetical protein